MFSTLFRLALGAVFVAIPVNLLAVPTAVDDAFTLTEDTSLTVALAALLDANFDPGGGGTISFAGDWAYLDEIENENGASEGYPTDGSGRDWKHADFDTESSTIGSWSTGALPLQAGTIVGFPGAPDVLGGLVAAGNGQNLVTTYLFRNSFTATAAQAGSTQWSVNMLVDDGCVIYVNGTEVLRHRLPEGEVTTLTYTPGSNPDESQYEQLPLAVPPGLFVTGTNTIAIEVHQAAPTSSDVGLDVQLQQGAGGGGSTGGFSYQDDTFGTGNPDFATGQHEPGGGFNGTGGLRVQAGGDTPNGSQDSSGGWVRQFSLASATVVEVSLRYRLIANSGFENDESVMALAEIDGARLGNDTNSSLALIQGGGNGGGDDDTGWQQESFTVPLAAGSHTLALGVYVSKSTVASEVADAYFDDVVVNGGGSGSGGVLTNDSGDAESLQATLLTQPEDGSVTMSPDGTFSYTPDGNYFGDDTFTYRASDNTGDSSPGTVTITVQPVNDPPVAGAKAYLAHEDQTLSPPAVIGVLQGASDIDNTNAQLTAVLNSDVSEGSLVLNPDGGFTYSPRSNFFGSDSFTFRATDGAAQSTAETVTITVMPVDDPPVATADSYSVDENAVLVVSVAQGGGGGSSIDMVAEGSTWQYLDDGSDQGVGWIATNFDDSSWATGAAQLGYGDGDEATVISYGPDENDKYATNYFRKTFNVADASIFEGLLLRLVRDDGAAVYLNGSEIARSNLEPDATFDTRPPPTGNENEWLEFDVDLNLLQTGANLLAVEVHQGSPDSSDVSFDLSLSGAVIAVRGLLDNDLDQEGAPLSAAVETLPPNGTLELNSDGTFSYTPSPNFFGVDTFQYEVSDGALTAIGTATITVVPGPNDVPEAVADLYAITEDQSFSANVANGVLDNDVDPDGDVMQALLTRDVAHGALSLNADGSFDYVPAADFFGFDGFAYRAADGIGQSAETAVTISVAGVNDRPVAQADSFVVQPGQVFAGSVVANDVDADNDMLTASLLADVASGTLNFSSDGTFTFDPGAFTGSTTFFYELHDATTTSTDAQVSLLINGRPTAVADGYSVVEDSTLTVAAGLGLLGNDSDPEGGAISALLLTDVANGSLSLGGDGAISYTPAADFFGTDTFTYVVTDGFQVSAPAVVTISVQPVNDPPLAAADDYGVVTNVVFSVDASEGVLANDSDADGDSLDATLLTDVSSGLLSLAADGSFTYTPAADFEGDDSFTYRADDGDVSSTATVTLHVGPDLKTIVINEIMYHPASQNDLEEYIELTNIGASAVDLTGWQFGDGVDFTFPPVSLAAGEFLVIAADLTAFEAAYGVVGNAVGGWVGRLSNSGERVRLYDRDGVEIDDLTYSDQGEWAARERVGGARGWDWNSDHDGGGQSLELVFAGLSNKQGQNWAASQGAPTPGVANTVAAIAVAPMILDVAHSPVVPKSNEPVRITARLVDEEGTSIGAALFWREAPRNPGEFTELPMADDGDNGDGDAGDGIYGATLPAMPDETVVEFYVAANDGTNARSWPPETNVGQVANAHYQVDDEVHNGNWPIYRIVMTAEEDNDWVNVNRGSNERFHATLILDDCSGPVIRYNSSIRVRGAGSRSHNPPPMRVSMPHDQPWNARTAMNWNTKYTYLQYIGMRLFQASGMAAPDGKPMRLRWNGANRMRDDELDYDLAVHMEVLDGDFIDDKHPADKEGNLYKKTRPDQDWAFHDGDVGDYRNGGWSKETNEDENDWTNLNQFLGVMNNAPGSGDYVAQVEAVADLDQWLKWFGAMAIIANGETNASNGADDDHSIYRGVVNPRFQFVPHDLDTILGKGDGSRITDPEHTIFDMISRGDVLGPLVPLFSEPAVQVRYYQALRELLQGSFAKAEFDELVDNSLAGWVPTGGINEIKSFMDARRNYITGLVDAELGAAPPVPLATTSSTLAGAHGALMVSEVLANNRAAFEINNSFPDFVELHNSGPSSMSLDGMTMTDDPSVPAKFVFPAGTSISAGGRIILLGDSEFAQSGLHLGFGLGGNGDSIHLMDGATTVDSVTFGLQIADFSIGRTDFGLNTWTLNTPTPGVANVEQPVGDPNGLRLNEWLTQPEVVFDRDFIEIYNPSPLPVALGGMAITDEPASDPTRYQLPALSFISAGGFSVFEGVGKSASAGNASELPFKLGSDQGWLAISGANGVGIDQVHYLCHRLDVSQGRSPDGSASYADYVLPTRGFSNATDLSNESAIVSGLRITELMYHPSGAGSEYVELRNVGTMAFNLAGVGFTSGIQFDFPSMVLQPDEYVLVVENLSAFQAQYGSALNVAGSYTSGKFSNGGERVRLEITSIGAGIHDFDYNDSWYPSTDGGGFALEIVDELAAPGTWREKASWRAGAITGGTPGGATGDPAAYDNWVVAQFGAPAAGLTGKLDDPDDDGVANVLEFVFGTDPESGDRGEMYEFTNDGGFLTMTYKRAVASIGLVQLVPQVSGDNQNWVSGGGVAVQELLGNDGTFETWEVRDATPIGSGQRRFLRILASFPEG